MSRRRLEHAARSLPRRPLQWRPGRQRRVWRADHRRPCRHSLQRRPRERNPLRAAGACRARTSGSVWSTLPSTKRRKNRKPQRKQRSTPRAFQRREPTSCGLVRWRSSPRRRRSEPRPPDSIQVAGTHGPQLPGACYRTSPEPRGAAHDAGELPFLRRRASFEPFRRQNRGI
jgi:hypothetical protein